MPLNSKLTENEIQDIVGNNLKNATGNVAVAYDQTTNQYQLLAEPSMTEITAQDVAAVLDNTQQIRYELSADKLALFVADATILGRHIAGFEITYDKLSQPVRDLLNQSPEVPISLVGVTRSGTDLIFTKSDGTTLTQSISQLNVIRAGAGANSIEGGLPSNKANSSNSVVFAGNDNEVAGNGNSAIIAGDHSLISHEPGRITSYCSAVIAGGTCTVYSNFSAAIGGTFHLVNGRSAVALAGDSNTVTGARSAAIGGISNTVSAANSAVVGGQNFATPSGFSDTLFTPKLYLFESGGGVSMLSPAGVRYIVTMTNNGQLAINGTELGAGGSYDDTSLSNRVSNVEVTAPTAAQKAFLNHVSVDSNGRPYWDNDFWNRQVLTLDQFKVYVSGQLQGGVQYWVSGTPYAQYLIVEGLNSTSVSPFGVARTLGPGGLGGSVVAKMVSIDYTNGNNLVATDLPTGSGGTTYTLPPATSTTLGGVKEGSGISIAADGTISATGGGTTGYDDSALKARVGAVETGKVDKVAGSDLMTSAERTKLAGLSNYSLPVATSTMLGGVKAGTNIAIAADGTISSTATGGASYDDTALKTRLTSVETELGHKVEDVELGLEGGVLTVYTNRGFQSSVTLPTGGGGSATIADRSIQAIKIATGTLTGNEVANNTLSGDKLTSNAVSTAKLQDGAVTGTKLAGGSVSADKLAGGAVVTSTIANDNVTEEKLSADLRAKLAVVNQRELNVFFYANSPAATLLLSPQTEGPYATCVGQNVAHLVVKQGGSEVYNGDPRANFYIWINTTSPVTMTITPVDVAQNSYLTLTS